MSRKDNELFISISAVNLILEAKVILEFFSWTDFFENGEKCHQHAVYKLLV